MTTLKEAMDRVLKLALSLDKYPYEVIEQEIRKANITVGIWRAVGYNSFGYTEAGREIRHYWVEFEVPDLRVDKGRYDEISRIGRRSGLVVYNDSTVLGGLRIILMERPYARFGSGIRTIYDSVTIEDEKITIKVDSERAIKLLEEAGATLVKPAETVEEKSEKKSVGKLTWKDAQRKFK